MAASASDVFQKVGRSTATTLSSPGYTIGNTSINVGSTTNWPTDTGITFAIDETELVNGEYVRVDGTYNIFRGTVNTATQITNVVYVGGDANRNYSAGATTRVYILVSYYRENRMVDGILDGHDQLGYHSKSLKDANGNEWLKPSATTSAVNEVTITNAATGSGPVISATGDDTNADITLKAKGTGVVKFGNVQGWSTGVLPAVSSVTNNGNRSYDVTFASTVAPYLTPGMRIRTTRTSAAPTQCTSLNGTTQYWTRASGSLTGTLSTITDDITVSAWIKLSSYPSGSVASIISRRNVTNGFDFRVETTGQISLLGLGTAGAYRGFQTYQSVPLNKWVHVSASLDMSGNTTTTNKFMIDGVDVPCAAYSGAGAVTAFIQAGNLDVGASQSSVAAAQFFPGKIAQVAVFNGNVSTVTQANIRSYMSQGMTGSETNCIFFVNFNNSTTDLSASANTLSAGAGSPTATNADSPFGGQADGTISSTLDYGIVTKVSTTVATVQVPEGCTIPTTGGVSSVDFSAWKAPYNMPVQSSKWRLSSLLNVLGTVTSNATFGSFLSNGWALNVPIGAWDVGWQAGLYSTTTTPVFLNISSASLTGLTSGQSVFLSRYQAVIQSTAAATYTNTINIRNNENLSSAATFLMYSMGATTSAGVDSNGVNEIFAELAYL